MKIEPLVKAREKLKNNIRENKDFKKGFTNGVDSSFEVFKKYVDGYNRYYDDIKLLLKEEKNIWKKWVNFYEKQNNINKENLLKIYNKWLFNYFFKFSSENELIFEI